MQSTVAEGSLSAACQSLNPEITVRFLVIKIGPLVDGPYRDLASRRARGPRRFVHES